MSAEALVATSSRGGRREPDLIPTPANGSASLWRRFPAQWVAYINVDMWLRVTEVMLEQPAQPPDLVSGLAQQTHHPEQHRDRDGTHQKSGHDRKITQPSTFSLGRSWCRHSLGVRWPYRSARWDRL
jgi:hypothetical protein